MLQTLEDTAPRVEEGRSWSVAADRCDRCGSQAMYITTKDKKDLLWCSHHYNKHSDALLTGGWAVETNDEGLKTLAVTPSL